MAEESGGGGISRAASLLPIKALGAAFTFGAIVAAIALGGLIIVGLISALNTPTQGQTGTGISDAVPQQYRAVVMRAGSICATVTPATIAAQIHAESGWNPAAESPAGAKGISQFMPGTWATHGLDGDGDGIADIMNPIDTIWAQGHYMCTLSAATTALKERGTINGDDLDLALAAYNAGLGNVTAHRGLPPFPETHAYIDRISNLIPTYSGTIGPTIGATGNLADALTWARGIATDKTNYYILGGNGPKGWDCSGLTGAFMARLGVNLPRTANEQSHTGTAINADQARPGDLIFWSYGGYATHTAIYAGNGWMISADSPSSGINFEPVYDMSGATITYRRHLG